MIVIDKNNLDMSDLCVIIPCHSTTDYIEKFQNILPKNLLTYFVFDRIKKPENFKGNAIFTDIKDNQHCAGLCRDIGAKNIIDKSIIFFDEDKVPSINPIPTIIKLKKYYDVITFTAEINDNRRRRNFHHEHGLIPQKFYSQREDNYTYTCGIYLDKNVIKDLRILNNGRIFNPIFDGIWGGEDDFLNDEVLALGYKIGYCNTITLNGKITDGNTERPDDLLSHRLRRYYLNAALSPVFLKDSTEEVKWGKSLINNKEETAIKLNNLYQNFINDNSVINI